MARARGFTGLGTDDKRKVALAAALGVGVLALAFNTLFGGPSTPTSAPAPARVTATPARTHAAPPATGPADPALHPELMAENENYLYAGSGRNIFSQSSAPPQQAAIERPKASARPSQQVAPRAVAAGPPPPPVVDLKFFGFAARKNGTKRAFLTHGDDVFVASEGDIVSHRYRVVSIAPTSIQIEDLPFHDTQTLPLAVN